MPPEALSAVQTALLYTALPGACGGVASFLLALRNNRYRNNCFIAKFCIEVVGAAVTAGFISGIFEVRGIQAPFAFCLGIGWSQVLHSVRARIDHLVEAALEPVVQGGKGNVA